MSTKFSTTCECWMTEVKPKRLDIDDLNKLSKHLSKVKRTLLKISGLINYLWKTQQFSWFDEKFFTVWFFFRYGSSFDEWGFYLSFYVLSTSFMLEWENRKKKSWWQLSFLPQSPFQLIVIVVPIETQCCKRLFIQTKQQKISDNGKYPVF